MLFFILAVSLLLFHLPNYRSYYQHSLYQELLCKGCNTHILFNSQRKDNFPRKPNRIYPAPLQKGQNQQQQQPTQPQQKISPPSKRVITPPTDGSIRLNKCLPTLSRRAADEAIAQGRVTVNNQLAFPGMKVVYGDIIKLDSNIQMHWEEKLKNTEFLPSADFDQQHFLYLKYWKPTGVTCTNDATDKDNIIKYGKFSLYPQRLFTVGRLDKDSSGIILLTSDGRVNNALLNSKMIKEKVYLVEMDKVPTEKQVEDLRNGVVITTSAQRDSGSKEITAKTLPCEVLPFSKIKNTHYLRGIQENPRILQFTLIEGRNRQIRKMAEAVGLNVVNLHRVTFAGISLKGLSEGNTLELNEKEMKIIQSAITQAAAPNARS